MHRVDRPQARPFLDRRSARTVTAVLLAAVAVLAVACGSDDTASTTTAKASASSSATSRPATSPPPTTSTTLAGTTRGSVQLHIGATAIALTSESCTSGTPTSIELTATDASGNTLKVDATDGSGSASLRGPSEDREGTVKSVQVGADGTFSVSGIMSVADDSAPGPDDLAISGLCA
ncbi:MAG: hypothetical protein JST64_02555 [Actinobacteria bacterium]|nr:hypothetical protein [Actinomycetota bacterium]